MSTGDYVLIGGMVASLALAVVAVYRARPQKDLDEASKKKIEEEVTTQQTAHSREQMRHIIRLENYISADIIYHRQSSDYQYQLAKLVKRAQEGGYLPGDYVIPTPPDPPELPELPTNGSR